MLDGLGMGHFNSWREDSKSNENNMLVTVGELCLSPHLVRTASVLLDSPKVRLYQDSLFQKRVGVDGWTPAMALGRAHGAL